MVAQFNTNNACTGLTSEIERVLVLFSEYDRIYLYCTLINLSHIKNFTLTKSTYLYPMQQENIFAVPRLPKEEIISFFTDLNIPITPSELLKPTSNCVYKIFYNILLELKYSPGSTELEIFIAMNNLLNKIGITSFTFDDFFQPRSDRLIFILSNLINFFVFSENRAELHSRKYREEESSLKLEMKNLTDEIAEKNKIIKSVERTKDDFAREREELEKIYAKNREELNQLEEQVKEEMKKYEEMKNEKNEILADLSAMRMERENLLSDIKLLEANIITDSSKIEINMTNLRKHLQAEQINLKKQDAVQKHIFKQKYKLLTEINLLKNTGKILQSYEEIKKTNEERKINFTEIKNENAIYEKERENFASGNLKLEKQLENLNAKFESIKNFKEKEIEKIKLKIEERKVKYEDQKKKEREIEQKKEFLIREIQKIENDIILLKKKHNQKSYSVLKQVDLLENNIYEYFK